MNKRFLALMALVCTVGEAQASFVDLGNGTILDKSTNLVWLQDWSQAAATPFDDASNPTTGTTSDGLMTWDNALAFGAHLSFAGYAGEFVSSPDGYTQYIYTSTPPQPLEGKWVLNDAKSHWELPYLSDYTTLLSDAGGNLYGAGFINLLGDYYSQGGPFGAIGGWWYLDTSNGRVGYETNNISGHYATAVRVATYADLNPVSAVPEPETYILMLAGLAAVGGAARRRMAG